MTFTEQLQTLEDPRHPINIRHDFFDILFLTVSAYATEMAAFLTLISPVSTRKYRDITIFLVE